jgi:hypothetical protein
METGKSPTRQLRVFLRDFRLVQAAVNLADGQALAGYFASRKAYVNLQNARWSGTDRPVEHAVLRVNQVLWASAPDSDISLTSASVPNHGRGVELQIEGGLLVRGSLVMGAKQRVSDYLEMAGPFVPVLNAQLLRSGRPPKQVNVELGDIVLNQDAIQAAWELALQPGAAEASADAGQAAGESVAVQWSMAGEDTDEEDGVEPTDGPLYD